MVCSLGNRTMATMARLLAAGNFSQTIAEEVGRQKLVAQYIQREFREADEANLLDEEDMHVFDLKPMTDPLHLVCCNSCKKPVKASQYAAHAEICRSLSTAEEVVSELDSSGCRKPLKKERKKPPSAHAGNTLRVDNARIMDGCGVCPGNTGYSTGAMPPPTKRSRLIVAEGPPISDNLATAIGVGKSFCMSTQGQDALACREFCKASSGGSVATSVLVPHQKISQVQDCCLATKGVPAPLATKVFYSQRNNRLRLAIAHLYYGAPAKEQCCDSVNPIVPQGNTMLSHASSPKNSTEQMNDEQGGKHSLPSVQKPDHILAESLDPSLAKLGGLPPTMNFSNQVYVNNASRPQKEPIGMMRSSYVSKPYSFAGNSGTPLGNMQQQPKGSVPVI